MEVERIDDYQIICEKGRIAAEKMDIGRWTIGDLACEVEKHYHRHMIDEFAKEINVSKARVKSYRTVSRFYQSSTRIDFLENHPNITWTHMRDAMRLGDAKSAYEFLETASGEGFTTDEALYHLIDNGAQNTRFYRHKGQGAILGLNGNQLTMRLESGVIADLKALVGKEVEITIQELD